jgi:hypothetical protein
VTGGGWQVAGNSCFNPMFSFRLDCVDRVGQATNNVIQNSQPLVKQIGW